jgi:hypothetical protein
MPGFECPEAGTSRAPIFGMRFLDLVGETSPEPIDPMADGFMTNIDPAFVRQVFDISK